MEPVALVKYRFHRQKLARLMHSILKKLLDVKIVDVFW